MSLSEASDELLFSRIRNYLGDEDETLAEADFAHDVLEVVHRLALARREVVRERLERGRHQARCSVFMQAMAWLARNGMGDRARAWVEKADERGDGVRLEDFVVAHVNCTPTDEKPE